MGVIAYLDESGDHSMKNVDPSSPIFCLTLALFDSDAYTNKIVPAFTELKFKYFGHDGVVPLRFITKANNLIGHQIADLAAYAVSRYAADTKTTYAPWHVVKDRIFDGRRGKQYGLKLFP